MPDTNQEWPSEDEDFDTVTNADELRKAVVNNEPNTNEVIEDKSVKNDDSIEQQPQEDTTESDDQSGINYSEANTGHHQSDQATNLNEVESSAQQPSQEEYIQPELVTGNTDSSETNVDAYSYNEGYSEVNETNKDIAPIPVDHVDTPTPTSLSKPPRVNFRPNNVIRYGVEALLVVAVILLGLSVASLRSDNTNLKNQVSKLNNNPQIVLQKETQQIIDAVGKLMQLPTGETPTIASVTDASQAKTQSAFFDNAQNGDKVLMYVKTGEAILYRPTTNRIVNVAPLTFTDSGSTSSTSTNSTSTNK